MLKSLLLPPGSILVVAVIGLLARRRWPRFSQTAVSVSIGLLYLLSTPLAAGTMLNSLQWYPALEISRDLDPDVGAIVVLSAGVDKDSPEYAGDTLDALSLERLRYAARLKRRFGLPILVTGGTLDEETRPVASLMADSLQQDFGLDADWVDAEATNTEYNARFSKAILAENGIDRVYLVTHAWHMPRSKAAFERHGITVVPAPMGFNVSGDGFSFGDFLPQATALAASSYAFHEWLGMGWYLIWYDALRR